MAVCFATFFRRLCLRRVAAALCALAPACAPSPARAHETVSIRSLREICGFQSVETSGENAVLLTRFHSLEIKQDSRRARFDGITVWLNAPVEKSWGRLRVARADVDKTILPLLDPRRALRREGYSLVVLDPGHGGSDRGAPIPGSALGEKHLTLELARNVRDILARYQVRVVLTREDDSQVSLEERLRTAAAWKADLFVSLHFNSAAGAAASGVETYFLAPAGFQSTAATSAGKNDGIVHSGNRHDAANMVLGYSIQRALLKHIRADDRGVRRARFVTLRDAPCSAALVEGGFLSNPAERKKLLTRSYRDDIARGVSEGIMAYLNAVKRAHGINP